MKYKYDPETDILLIQMGNEKPDFGEQRGNIITHYSRKGNPIEIEIMDASRTAVKMLEAIMQGRKAPVHS